jgi:hypothetical protein
VPPTVPLAVPAELVSVAPELLLAPDAPLWLGVALVPVPVVPVPVVPVPVLPPPLSQPMNAAEPMASAAAAKSA